MPAYNESENIEASTAQWYPIIQKYGSEDSALVIVNDGSTDDTSDKLAKLKNIYPKLIPLTKKNGGHGSAVIFGYRYAIDNKADLIFQTDSDGQTSPEEFGKFWKLHGKYDAVIGKRLKRGDGLSRKLVEDAVCILLRLIFGIKVRDANAPFRLMKAKLVKKYIGRLPSDYNIPNIMLTAFFVFYRERVRFLEISFKPRQKGRNKLNYKKMFFIGIKAIRDFMRFKKEMKRPQRKTHR